MEIQVTEILNSLVGLVFDIAVFPAAWLSYLGKPDKENRSRRDEIIVVICMISAVVLHMLRAVHILIGMTAVLLVMLRRVYGMEIRELVKHLIFLSLQVLILMIISASFVREIVSITGLTRNLAALADVMAMVFVILMNIGMSGKIRHVITEMQVTEIVMIVIFNLCFLAVQEIINIRAVPTDNRWINVLELLAELFLFIAYGLIMRTIVLYKLLKQKSELTGYYLDVQKEQIDHIRSTEIETRKFRHDIINHVDVIRTLCANDDAEGVKQYIEELYGKLEGLRNGYSLNNSVADAIAHRYEVRCKDADIDLLLSGHFPTECRISMFDMCTILSNILQNAYEAVRELPDEYRQISLRVFTDEGDICIEEMNYSLHADFVSRKNDNKSHRFGLENIRSAVLHYGGMTDYRFLSEENNINKYQIRIIIAEKDRGCKE